MPVDIEKLEAVIESAMRDAVRQGLEIGSSPDCDRCPLAAVALVLGKADWTRVDSDLGLPIGADVSFGIGFDHPSTTLADNEFIRLGRKFRQRVDAGEFSRAVVCPEMP